MNSKIRLNTYISRAGIASRRKADELISRGLVKVNGEVVTQMGVKIDPLTDEVSVKNNKIQAVSEYVYYAVNKPPGYVSTVKDDQGRKTVLELVPAEPKVFPVGRLDMESEGLLLITNDGDFTFRMTHPNFHIPKTYQVLINGELNSNQLRRIKTGLQLKNFKATPAKVQVLDREDYGSWVEITITEGRNRQVRRMMKGLGFETLRLIRTGIGSLNLDELGEEKVMVMDEEQISRIMDYG